MSSSDYHNLLPNVSYIRNIDLIFHTFPGGCDQVDIGFVLDSSGSLQESGDNWATLKNFTVSIIQRLDVGPTKVRVAVVQFSGHAIVEFNLERYRTKQEIINAVYAMEFLGTTTYTGEGLRFLRERVFDGQNGDRPGVPNIGIVITDGKSNIREEETAFEANRTKSEGVRLIAVGITDQIDMNELQTIASKEEDVFTVDNFDRLVTILADVLDATCRAVSTDSPGRLNKFSIMYTIKCILDYLT